MGDDSGARKCTQVIAAIIATLGAFALGTSLGWSSPAIPRVTKDLDLSDEDGSWIGSILNIGAIFVMLIIGFCIQWAGRKLAMIAFAPLYIISYLIISFGNNFYIYLVGRFLCGFAGASYSVSVPVYIGEMSQPSIRGMLSTFFQFQITLGILFVYCVGLVDNIIILGLPCAIIIAVFLVLLFFIPESPYHLVAKGKSDKATVALKWLRGPNYDSEKEVTEIEKSHAESQARKGTMKDICKNKAYRKALGIMVGFMFAQQLSGINAVIFYTVTIFEAAGSDIDPNISSIIVGVVQVLATFVAVMTVDRVGRRILWMVSTLVMAVCLALLGIFFFLKENSDTDTSNIGWLPLLSLCVYIVGFSLGAGPLPWSMLGEMFPSEIKGPASSFSSFMNWFLSFVVTKSFPSMKNAFGTAATMWTFMLVCILSFVLIMAFVPETKGKTLEEIQEELAK